MSLTEGGGSNGQRPARKGRLRPPWRKGQSGNPLGRPRKDRTLISKHYEQIGRRTVELEAARVAASGLPGREDSEGWRRRLDERRAELAAIPATKAIAAHAAHFSIVGERIRWLDRLPGVVVEGHCARPGCGRVLDVRMAVALKWPGTELTVWFEPLCLVNMLSEIAQHERHQLAGLLWPGGRL